MNPLKSLLKKLFNNSNSEIESPKLKVKKEKREFFGHIKKKSSKKGVRNLIYEKGLGKNLWSVKIKPTIKLPVHRATSGPLKGKIIVCHPDKYEPVKIPIQKEG